MSAAACLSTRCLCGLWVCLVVNPCLLRAREEGGAGDGWGVAGRGGAASIGWPGVHSQGGKKVSGKKGLPPVPLYTPRLSSWLPLKG